MDNARRVFKKTSLWVMAGIVFTVVHLGPYAATAASTDNTLRLRYWQTPTTLIPHLASGYKDIGVCRIVYEPLASFDSAGNLIPFLAAEIPSLENGGVAADGLSVTWKLKPGVKWADGVPFTAQDVRFTYQLITNPAVNAASANNYQAIKAVEAPDDLTVKILFKERNPAWAVPFVGYQGMILPRHLYEPYNNAQIRTLPPDFAAIGTGPYRLVAYTTEDMLLVGNDLVNIAKIVYAPNPYFREPGKPYFQRLEAQGGGDQTLSAQSLFVDGTVDYVYDFQLEPQKMAHLETLGKGRAIPASSALVERLLLNRADPQRATAAGERASLQFPHPLFSDQRVRQAFAHAVDRAAIAEIYGKAGRPTTNLLTSPARYDSPHTANLYPFDAARAAALLDEAGWRDTDGDGIRDKDGVKMRVTYQTSVSPIRQQVQQLIKRRLEALGVEVALSFIDGGVFFNPDPANTNSFIHFYADLEQYSIGPSQPDPTNYMAWWTCSQIPQQSNNWAGYNLARWCNPAYDALFQQATVELDPVKRRELFIRLNDLLIEEVAVIPLIARQTFVGLSNTLEGVELNQWDMDTWKIKDWRRKAK